jgi:hypothetical protein
VHRANNLSHTPHILHHRTSTALRAHQIDRAAHINVDKVNLSIFGYERCGTCLKLKIARVLLLTSTNHGVCVAASQLNAEELLAFMSPHQRPF